MNNWESIWKKKGGNIEVTDDVFEMFKELKKANGFDVMANDGYYQGFFDDFKSMADRINEYVGDCSSLYEVGCGSGVNLFLFNRLYGINKLGGCDYSDSLLNMAKAVSNSDDIECLDAEQIRTDDKYDIVLSDSVFQYFTSPEKGYHVLEKMYEKADKIVVVTEVHDKALEEEHLKYRRSKIENYDELYKGLDKTFYDKEKLQQFADKRGAKCFFIKPENDTYWNNAFVFDYYLIKNN